MTYTDMEMSIIKLLQEDLPLKPHPYEDLAKQYAVSEAVIVGAIKQMYEQKRIRRLGAVLRHQRVGFKYNAMVVWQVPETEADRTGSILASFQEVSHCYLRETPADFNYNLFTMIHCRDQEHLDGVLLEMKKQTGIESCLAIKSVRELKKVSMKYV